MKLAKIFIVFTFLLVSLFISNSCSSRAKSSSVIYLIPDKFEGAVVIFYDQKDGIKPNITEEGYIFTIPIDGVLKVDIDAKSVNGKPKFFLVDEGGKRIELEYLYSGGPKYPEGMRTDSDISNEERDNKIFAMIYEQGNFNISSGIIRFGSFLICKPKDGNLFASRDLNHKITDFQKTFSR